MYVSDDLLFLITLLLAVYFTIETFDFPIRTQPGEKVVQGVIAAHIRAIVFPFIAAGFWFVMTAFAASLNNCSTSFGGAGNGCYTSPAFTSATSTIYASGAGQTLYYLFDLMFYAMIVCGIAFAVYFAFRPLMEKPEVP